MKVCACWIIDFLKPRGNQDDAFYGFFCTFGKDASYQPGRDDHDGQIYCAFVINKGRVNLITHNFPGPRIDGNDFPRKPSLGQAFHDVKPQLGGITRSADDCDGRWVEKNI